MAQLWYYSDIKKLFSVDDNQKLMLGSSILLSANLREKPKNRSFYQQVGTQTHLLNLDLSYYWYPRLIRNDKVYLNFGFPLFGHLYTSNFSGIGTTEVIFGIWDTPTKFMHSRATYEIPFKKLKLGIQYTWQYQNVQNYNIYSINNLGVVVGF
jgi:hypothetical protein